MSMGISTLREENQNKVGVVSYVGAIMLERWVNCAPMSIIRLGRK
jgi:hypothetical protein